MLWRSPGIPKIDKKCSDAPVWYSYFGSTRDLSAKWASRSQFYTIWTPKTAHNRQKSAQNQSRISPSVEPSRRIACIIFSFPNPIRGFSRRLRSNMPAPRLVSVSGLLFKQANFCGHPFFSQRVVVAIPPSLRGW